MTNSPLPAHDMAEKKKSLFSCSRRKQDREHRENERHRQIMTALENLTQSITDLTAAVDRVSTKFPVGGTEAEVQTAADGVNAQVARLNTLVPPPPPPTP